ncbi:MAG TPA: hypothetical protein VGU43_07415 [Thermoplasmata archaeon]|nr:hypothetical protein [Thermoplasmata archaeon]
MTLPLGITAQLRFVLSACEDALGADPRTPAETGADLRLECELLLALLAEAGS